MEEQAPYGEKVKEVSQNQKILNHMVERGRIDQMMAFDLYGCFRLGARIHDIKNKEFYKEQLRELGKMVWSDDAPNASGRGYHAIYYLIPWEYPIQKKDGANV